MASDRATILKRLLALAVVAGALVFAVQGGEFSTLDLIRQRRESARIQRAIDSLQRVVDSLTVYRAKVEHDSATQERIAREVFGMVRGDKEIIYRFANPDTTRAP